jgi:hypothetical protein
MVIESASVAGRRHQGERKEAAISPKGRAEGGKIGVRAAANASGAALSANGAAINQSF